MFSFFRNWLDNRIINRSDFRQSEWDETFAFLPLLTGLTDEERQRLIRLAILFIHRKSFEGVHNLVITRHMVLMIALQACLPILNLSLENYNGWVSIIVYPAGFAPRREYIDEAGVVHRERDQLLGESWQHGPVILSWNDVENAGRIDGENLVIHEFAHKLDMQNGSANGYPPLHPDMVHDDWVKAFSEGYQHFKHACKSHHAPGFNCYGTSSAGEFFAVFSEIFFERPGLIKKHYPEIYYQLYLYYRQDPSRRLSR